MRTTPPHDMRTLLRTSLGRSLRALSPDDRLAAAWPIACGSALASHGTLTGLDADAVLHVAVPQDEWLQQFVQVRSALANDLGRIAGVPLKAIHFQKR